MLRKRSSDIASFVEHPVCSIFRMYNVLILICTIQPKCMYKSDLFLKFLVFRKGSNLIASFVEHPVYSIFSILVYSIFLVLVVLYRFSTIHPKCMPKSYLFLKFQVLHEGGGFIASLMEHPVCSSFQMYSVLILVFLFQLATINRKGICKSQFLLKF